MNIDPRLFIDFLRAEAIEAKKCITQYSFQCLALSGAAIGIIITATNQEKSPYPSLSTASIIIILMIMSKITVYKYQVANRAYGYEMYIKEMMYVSDNQIPNINARDLESWAFLAENEQWEKSLLIYKNISNILLKSLYKPTRIFDYVPYRFVGFIFSSWLVSMSPQKIIHLPIAIAVTCIAYPLIDPFKYRLQLHKSTKGKATVIEDKIWVSTIEAMSILDLLLYWPKEIVSWCCKKSNFKDNLELFSGTYLEHLLNMLALMQALALSPILVAMIKIGELRLRSQTFTFELQDFFFFDKAIEFIQQYKYVTLATILFLILQLIIARYLIVKQQIAMLETGLYSVRTNYMLWKIVARINYEAWNCAITHSVNQGNADEISFSLENMYDENVKLCANLVRKFPNNPKLWTFEKSLNSRHHNP
jgi:hypothetical protein